MTTCGRVETGRGCVGLNGLLGVVEMGARAEMPCRFGRLSQIRSPLGLLARALLLTRDNLGEDRLGLSRLSLAQKVERVLDPRRVARGSRFFSARACTAARRATRSFCPSADASRFRRSHD
jgi:hypothetical protein